MATFVFAQEKSVFFITDGGGGNTLSGGCTQEWWDAAVDDVGAAAAKAKLMYENGNAFKIVDGVQYFEIGNLLRKPNIHVDVEVGMVLYAYKTSGAGFIVSGRYIITSVNTNELICDGIDGTDCIVTVAIGGSWDEDQLQDALDDTDATDHSVTIYVQGVTTLSAKIDADTGGGTPAKNTFKRIIGFNTIPGDMNYGRAYYESPDEILQNGLIDSNKTVVLDADDGGFSVLDITVDNIIFENFHLYNSVGQRLLVFTGTPKNIIFRNCRFSEGAAVFSGYVDEALFDSCYSGDLTGAHYTSYASNYLVYLNCVLDMAAGVNGIVGRASSVGVHVIGCIFNGGARSIRFLQAGTSALAMNNTFYNQTAHGIYGSNAESVIVINNIFMLATGAIGINLFGSVSCSYNDYNCFIEVDGTPLTVGAHGSGYEAPVIGPHSIEVDPNFVDPANGDFRLQPGSPCLNTGKPIVSNGYSNIGAWQRKQYPFRVKTDGLI